MLRSADGLADLDKDDSKHETVLYFAITKGHIEVVVTEENGRSVQY